MVILVCIYLFPNWVSSLSSFSWPRICKINNCKIKAENALDSKEKNRGLSRYQSSCTERWWEGPVITNVAISNRSGNSGNSFELAKEDIAYGGRSDLRQHPLPSLILLFTPCTAWLSFRAKLIYSLLRKQSSLPTLLVGTCTWLRSLSLLVLDSKIVLRMG